jgi:hypothetical protein
MRTFIEFFRNLKEKFLYPKELSGKWTSEIIQKNGIWIGDTRERMLEDLKKAIKNEIERKQSR